MNTTPKSDGKQLTAKENTLPAPDSPVQSVTSDKGECVCENINRKFKNAFITILGRTNTGKSTLFNVIIGQRIAAVSPKPQTTRTKITGILTENDTQLVFIDTPGLHNIRTSLGQHMTNAANSSAVGVDGVIFVTDCTKPDLTQSETAVLKRLCKAKTPVVLAVNKIDLLDSKADILKIIGQFSDEYNLDAIIPVSAKHNDGVYELLERVRGFAKESPMYFPADMITDQSERIIAAEIIREPLLYNLNYEVPHGIAVDVETFKERKNGAVLDISAVIYTEKNSHKGIIIGKGGSKLKDIGTKARQQLEDFYQIKVNLQLWVKVKENWRNRDGIIKDFGLLE
jgi:GTP-binding protein Era